VARAAVEALRGVPESAEALRTLADDEVVTEAVRRAAR
jgi:chromosome segregation and condensation protein ScpB